MDSHITWFSTASSGKCLGMECLQKLLGDKYESSIRWWGRRMCIHLLLRELQNYNSLLNNCRLENVGSHHKRYPTSKGKGEAQQEGRRGEIEFRIKPLTCQRCSEGSNKPCVYQDPETPQRARPVFECLLQRFRSAVDCFRDRGFGYSRLGYGISPLGGGCH